MGFRERVGNRCKRLFYSLLVAAPLLSNSPEAGAIPRPTSFDRQKIAAKASFAGEKILGVKFNGNSFSVLTDRHLTIIKERRIGKFSLQKTIRADIRHLNKIGIVDWAVGKKRFFILTRDGYLTVDLIYKEVKPDIHPIPDNVAGARMRFHKGSLLIELANKKKIEMKFE